MRKINPADVRAQFSSDVNRLLGHFDRVAAALAGTSSEKQDISQLASRSFLSLFVMFERFCSDLFLAYLNRDFSSFQSELKTRVNDSITDRFGAWTAARTRYTQVTHVAVDDLEQAVDPEGRNLTFKSAQDIVDRAGRWLAPQHRGRVQTLDASDKRLIDTARAVRNFIAHRSASSKRKMNDALATVTAGTHNAGLGRGTNQVHSVGAFMKAFAGSDRRLHGYVKRFKQVAGKM